MKHFFLFLLLTISLQTIAQKKADNIIVITTDGFAGRNCLAELIQRLPIIHSSMRAGKNSYRKNLAMRTLWKAEKNCCPLFGARLLNKDKSMETGILIIK